MLGDKRLIRSIRLRNLLSFGPESEEIELRSLNVLIGPNGSGKSNLIDAIDLLRACPNDLTKPLLASGGVAEWLWKGKGRSPNAEISVRVSNPPRRDPLGHRLEFTSTAQHLQVRDEAIEDSPESSLWDNDVAFYYRYQHGHPQLNVQTDAASQTRQVHSLRPNDIPYNQSVISQRRSIEVFPELTYLGEQYSRVRVYRGWDRSTLRHPQLADLPTAFLADDASNLALVLNRLISHRSLRSPLVDRLGQFDQSIVDMSVSVEANTVQVLLHQDGLSAPIPATRLSDGTLRYLCLLSILLHPDPPPLICIEEPEIGLHPDIMPTLAELLIEASERTQLIVTTHSDILVDALTGHPEAVLVCEKPEASTIMRRLSKAELTQWLKRYGLGDLWRKGQLGGNRW